MALGGDKDVYNSRHGGVYTLYQAKADLSHSFSVTSMYNAYLQAERQLRGRSQSGTLDNKIQLKCVFSFVHDLAWR